ncbi:hypothetical protein THICB2_420020 [Thiomonas sp. CB2]|nr:hypothetical protein THICB2_420020 [Thiomonas sp. CB2]CQR43214.1 hypothetical protein THICB3320264 [Thiomonas sp. CB3]VDY04763.1 protein of unknown function [Thiomonas sp. Bio17B3]VDY13018.1 conserved protein of unknown function [Thiomonas sp. OC7]VDY17779.1 protein of unknown function [Thiomonas sp. CB2]
MGFARCRRRCCAATKCGTILRSKNAHACQQVPVLLQSKCLDAERYHLTMTANRLFFGFWYFSHRTGGGRG